MLKKVIMSTVIIIGFSSAAFAKGDTHLINLASIQEAASQNIIKAYKKDDTGSVLASLRVLESGHKSLESKISNPEIKNLLVYLNLCIKNLKDVVKKPHTPQNAQKVADLSASISEGSHYIVAKL